MEEKEVLVDVSDRVGTMTINRPHVMNAMASHTTPKMLAAVKELSERDDVGCIVIRGAGDRVFCAGHDLKEMTQQARHGVDLHVECQIIEALANSTKPTLAAVKGYCRGGGNWVAGSCDIVVACEDATFALPQLNFSHFEVVPAAVLMRRIGRAKVMDMILTTDVIDVREAKAIGLVDRILPVEGFWDGVYELARKIASRDPQAVKAGKEALWLLADADMVKGMWMMYQAMMVYFMSAEVPRAQRLVSDHLAAVASTRSRRR
ncbi:MAG: enoyl-CoA hydratase/isomerase family protein [Chloroflexi bacterium]|nr:enoyl-CoA hydratase/isomerase family protein [Chloroflexota bacterium]